MIDTCNPVIEFVVMPHVYRYSPDMPLDGQEKENLKVRLQQWLYSFEAFLHKSEATMNDQDRQGATILRIQHTLVYVWLLTRGFLEQASYDAYITDFRSIISLVETLDESHYSGLLQSIHPKAKSAKQPPAFVFDLYVIPVLYFVAIKCRHPLIRRKAISLLSSSPRREGLWDAAPVARVAERVMQIEEEPLENPLNGELPPEWSRVHDADFKNDFCRPGLQQVQFQTKPEGLEGEIRIWDEYI